MEQEYEQLKLDNLSLTEQVEALGGGQTTNGTDSNGENGDTTNASTTNNSQTNTNQSSNSTSAGSTTYTVQSGDTYWGIATKVYGNGSYYTKILSANGLTEKDTIQAGTVLTIPAL
ncbi:LysM peptidoglycan-binding domain-containing protein [Anaerotignum sp. MSJ-24]|nr:LysM peptidoglycan-binding domain-containing protein [Anaerotignum sp. MSJ-24]